MVSGKESRITPLDAVNFKIPENSPYGLLFEPYTQLEEVGFSIERVQEARKNQELADKGIVVLGASYSGIGGAVLREAALQGARVLGISRKESNHPEVSKLMEEVKEIGGRGAYWLSADITEKDAKRRIIETAVSEIGKIDGMVIAVADIDDKLFTDYTDEEFDSLFDVNFTEPRRVLRATLKLMQEQREGKIVVVSSISAAGTPGQSPYSAGKAGLEALVRGMPIELIRYRGRITVNALASGFVADTPLTKDLTDKQQGRILDFSTAQRSLLPAEVAEPIVYLLNPNTQVNGKVIPMVGRGPIPSIDERRMTIRLGDRERFNFEPFSNTQEYVKLCEDFVNRTLPVTEGAIILDLAAGTGVVTSAIRERDKTVGSTIIGVDPNLVSLEKAEERVVGDEKTKVGFVLGDGRQLPVPSGIVNYTYMGNAIHEIKGDNDKCKIFEELHRVLTSDGIAYINSAFTEESYPNPNDQDLKDSSETRIWGLLKLYAISEIPGAERNKDWGKFEVKKTAEYKQIMEEAGFKKISWTRQRVELSIEAIEAISEYDEFIRGVFVDVRKEDGSTISLEEGSKALKAAARRLERKHKEKYGEDAEFIFPRYWVEFTLKKELSQAA